MRANPSNAAPLPAATGAPTPCVTVIQDAARRHYMVPVALQQLDMLDRVYTGFYAKGQPLDRLLVKLTSMLGKGEAARMAQRRHPDLDRSRIIHFPIQSIRQRLSRKHYPTDETYYVEMARQEADRIIARGYGRSNALYGSIRNVHPSLLADARKRGLVTFGDQIIAPAVIEQREVDIQLARFPDWEIATNPDHPGAFADFERESWALCDQIVCGSDYVTQGLVSLGVSAAKVAAIPYVPTGSNLQFVDRSARTGPVHVGFVGQVGLRKGAGYFFEVAKRFDPARVKFSMVGPIKLSEVGRSAAGHVALTGAVPMQNVREHLANFDILLFPSTCEGCAGAVLEAMETGLPVVSTPNSGTIIKEGNNGYIRAYDDIDGLTDCVNMLAQDKQQRLQMGFAAHTLIQSLTMDWYCVQLSALLVDRLSFRLKQ